MVRRSSEDEQRPGNPSVGDSLTDVFPGCFSGPSVMIWRKYTAVMKVSENVIYTKYPKSFEGIIISKNINGDTNSEPAVRQLLFNRFLFGRIINVASLVI